MNDKDIELPDGAYDISDIEYEVLNTEEPDDEDIEAWIKKHPEGCIAIPYQKNTTFLLSKRPTPLSNDNMIGMEFYKYQKTDKKAFFNGLNSGGAAVIIDNCPKTILICAEDD